jgi:hypothetical protein
MARNPPDPNSLNKFNKYEDIDRTSTGYTGPRVINKHDFTETLNQEEYVSAVLYPSGESHFQEFTNKTSDPAVHIDASTWKHDTDKYSLLNNDAIISPSGDSFSEYIESNSFLEPKEFSFPYSNDALSNANETRKNAITKGLYDTPAFNPYIHYAPGSFGVIKVDYAENFKVATKYLDPYSDYYVFQTSISSGAFTQDPNTDIDEAPSDENGSSGGGGGF